MSAPSRRRAFFLAVAATLAVALLATWVWFGRVVVYALRPAGTFDAARVPPAPSYERPDAWAAWPTAASARDADVFYVHPTTFIGAAWNARLDDATVNKATELGGTAIQASAFADCCAIYAPRYRQANLTAFLEPTASGARALDLATGDVLDAFRAFLARRDGRRPFLLVGHSQGAVLAFRVLTALVARSPLREKLVAAWIIGSPLTEASLAAASEVPACDSPTQTGCVIAWNARGPRYQGGLDFVEAPTVPPRPWSPRVCVNPLSWRHDEALAAAGLHRGAVFFRGLTPDAPIARMTSARCRRGALIVEPTAPIPRDFMSRLLDHALGDESYHPVEFGLFYENIRENARARIAAWQRQQPSDAQPPPPSR